MKVFGGRKPSLFVEPVFHRILSQVQQVLHADLGSLRKEFEMLRVQGQAPRFGLGAREIEDTARLERVLEILFLATRRTTAFPGHISKRDEHPTRRTC